MKNQNVFLRINAVRMARKPEGIEYTMTARELMDLLECVDGDMPVIISEDFGMFYGPVLSAGIAAVDEKGNEVDA